MTIEIPRCRLVTKAIIESSDNIELCIDYEDSDTDVYVRVRFEHEDLDYKAVFKVEFKDGVHAGAKVVSQVDVLDAEGEQSAGGNEQQYEIAGGGRAKKGRGSFARE